MKSAGILRAGMAGFALIAGTACSSGRISAETESRFSDLSEKTVVARSDGSTTRPGWIEGEVILHEDLGWTVLGFSTSPRPKGPDGAITAAGDRARRELSDTVVGRLESILEIHEPSAVSDRRVRSELLRAFGMRLRATLVSITPVRKQYWEQLPQSYRGFARIAVTSTQLRQAVLMAADTAAGRKSTENALAPTVRRHLEGLLSLDSIEVLPLGQMSPAGQN